jgi:hypothetical protein
MRKLAFGIIVMMAASLTTTACGGDDNKASDSAPRSSSTVSSSDKSPSATRSTAASSDDSGGGSDPGSAYCTELKNAKSRFKNLDITGLSDDQFQKVAEEFDAIASAAPADVKDDWNTVAGALKQVHKILSDAGLSFSDLQGLSSGHLPKGVTPQTLKKVGRQLATFGRNSHFQEAATTITAAAKAECGIDMGGDESGS